MEFVLLIIVGVIVAIISAATKKKPQSSGEQGAPPRPTMSDIQRAFMMAAGLQDDEQNPPPVRPTAPYTPPAAPYTQPTAPYAPYEQTTEPTAAYAAPSVAESYSGLADDAGVRPMAAESVNPYTGVQVSSYFMDEEDKDQMPQVSPAHRQQTGASAGIPLFKDQRDIVKAFIYAEILPRRNGAQRLR